MYSLYKSGIILKFFVGIILYGVVFFVFLFYIGFILDKELIKCCGILDFLECNDGVMVDKGFNIDDFLYSKGV